MSLPVNLADIAFAFEGNNPGVVVKLPTPPFVNPLGILPPIPTGIKFGRLPVFASFDSVNQTGRFVGLAITPDITRQQFDRNNHLVELFHMDYQIHLYSRREGVPGEKNWANWDDQGFEFQIPRKEE